MRYVSFACVMLITCAWSSAALAQGNVITIGDSWAWLVAPSVQDTLNVHHPGKVVHNESFGGGTAAQHAADLAGITARINAHPDADIVLLSSGGNDMLLGLAGGGFYVGNPNNAAVYANIASNVNTVVNHILSIRPDIQVVIQGYDYLNLWDGSLFGAAGDVFRANYGLFRADTGNVFLDLVLNVQQNAQLNQGFRDAEQGKIAIAGGSRRVHHVNNFGLNTALVGYSGALGLVLPSGVYPPDIAPDAPVTSALLIDPIHLNPIGYANIANRAQADFFATAFLPANLSLSIDTLTFGNVRIGTSASLATTASNAGPNFTKVQNLTFDAASGEFSGAAESFDPLFRDPSLGSDTVAKSYSYAPTARGADAQNLAVTSNSGGATLALSGVGVGPEFDASVADIDFGSQFPTAVVTLPIDVGNFTPDDDLGSLTDLTLLAAEILGPNDAQFSLLGFTPGTVLGKGESLALSVEFTAGGPDGLKEATLRFTTDQGAALGEAGMTFDIPLSALQVVPEPSSFVMASIPLFALAMYWRRRRLRS